jgi:Flp pilus assembly pilin Flp
MSIPLRDADFLAMAPSGRRWRREEGQTMAEYAIVLAVITPILVVLFGMVGDAIIPTMTQVAGFL